MAEALGFEPPALLVERTPSEDMLPLDEPEVEEPPQEPPGGSVH